MTSFNLPRGLLHAMRSKPGRTRKRGKAGVHALRDDGFARLNGPALGSRTVEDDGRNDGKSCGARSSPPSRR